LCYNTFEIYPLSFAYNNENIYVYEKLYLETSSKETKGQFGSFAGCCLAEKQDGSGVRV
jgi:hypothetical protein